MVMVKRETEREKERERSLSLRAYYVTNGSFSSGTRNVQAIYFYH